ncbi:MAG: glycosyltransferase family 4 protein [Clostridia bacterium]|nr:glycosyltransferase family 4 protein [Clostridia bacterium]MBQ2518239.1 glycosyltransferase family 4 protein [Clostridia bacterium]
MAIKRRDILFLCQYFYPELNSSATLPFDTAKYLAGCGYKVDALCGYPKEYNTRGRVPRKEVKDGVSITRLHYLQLKRRSRLGRLINYATFTAAALLRLPFFGRYKALVVYSNPPILPLVSALSKAVFGTKTVCVSYDVYPEIAYASGSLTKNGSAAKFMARINRSVCARADKVIALTDEMKEYLLSVRQELDASRVAVIPNWAHEGFNEDRAAARKKLGYDADDFIVCYFGNMGVCQDTETMRRAIELLKDRPRVKFLIAGHGSKLDALREATANNPNVRICSFLEGDEFETAVASGSCGIVSLEPGLKGMCAPSKYYTVIQGGLPVLAIVEKGSYLAEEAEREGVGVHIQVGDGQALADAIIRLSEDAEGSAAMGAAARELYFDKYCMSRGLAKYKAVFDEQLCKDE